MSALSPCTWEAEVGVGGACRVMLCERWVGWAVRVGAWIGQCAGRAVGQCVEQAGCKWIALQPSQPPTRFRVLCRCHEQVRLPLSSLPCTYKYGIRRSDGSLELEAGENRMVALPVRAWRLLSPCLHSCNLHCDAVALCLAGTAHICGVQGG